MTPNDFNRQRGEWPKRSRRCTNSSSSLEFDEPEGFAPTGPMRQDMALVERGMSDVEQSYVQPALEAVNEMAAESRGPTGGNRSGRAGAAGSSSRRGSHQHETGYAPANMRVATRWRP